MCSRKSYCERCSQCRSSVGCEARYADAVPGRPYLKVCGCGRERLSVASRPQTRFIKDAACLHIVAARSKPRR
jgi:hypothetical protein